MKAEKQGMLVEGFCAEKLTAAQAQLASSGGHKHNEQVNILNLPLPDFEIVGRSPTGLLTYSDAFPFITVAVICLKFNYTRTILEEMPCCLILLVDLHTPPWRFFCALIVFDFKTVMDHLLCCSCCCKD
jgi:hypothetical protein